MTRSQSNPPRTPHGPATPMSPHPSEPPTFAPPPTAAGRTKSGTGASQNTPNSNAGWSNGLFACPPSDLSTCCLGLFCPCIVYSRTNYRLSKRSAQNAGAGAGTNLLGWSACDGSCLGFAILCGCQGILAAILRTRVRRMYGVEGGVGDDAVIGCCCCCCAVVQSEREVRKREEDEGYKRVSGMRYAPEEQQNRASARV